MEIGHRDELTPEQRADWDALCGAMVQAMSALCRPYLTPISQELNATQGQLACSGAYIEFDVKRWLISNAHVLEHWASLQYTHEFIGCEHPFRLLAPPRAIEKHPIDAALWEIPDTVRHLQPHHCDAIPASRLADRHAPVDGELLFFCGYPQERSHCMFGTLASFAVPVVTQDCRPPIVENLHPNYLLLGYSPEHAQRVDPRGRSLPDAAGLSGSLVWNTRLVECVQQHRTWSPDLAQVTGMLVRSDTQLVAVQMVRIEVIRDFLERNARYSADQQPSNSY